MRGIALAFLFCLVSIIGHAQTTLNKPVYCGETAVMLQIIKDRYQESPVWIGSQTRGILMLMVNQITQTWTLLEIYDQVACVLGTGDKFNAMQPPDTVL